MDFFRHKKKEKMIWFNNVTFVKIRSANLLVIEKLENIWQVSFSSLKRKSYLILNKENWTKIYSYNQHFKVQKSNSITLLQIFCMDSSSELSINCFFYIDTPLINFTETYSTSKDDIIPKSLINISISIEINDFCEINKICEWSDLFLVPHPV